MQLRMMTPLYSMTVSPRMISIHRGLWKNETGLSFLLLFVGLLCFTPDPIVKQFQPYLGFERQSETCILNCVVHCRIFATNRSSNRLRRVVRIQPKITSTLLSDHVSALFAVPAFQDFQNRIETAELREKLHQRDHRRHL